MERTDEQQLTGLRKILKERKRGLAVKIARELGVDRSTVTYWCKAGVPDERVKPLAAFLKVAQRDIRR